MGKHKYVEDRWEWKAGRFYQILRCRLCGHESWGWLGNKKAPPIDGAYG